MRSPGWNLPRLLNCRLDRLCVCSKTISGQIRRIWTISRRIISKGVNKAVPRCLQKTSATFIFVMAFREEEISALNEETQEIFRLAGFPYNQRSGRSFLEYLIPPLRWYFQRSFGARFRLSRLLSRRFRSRMWGSMSSSSKTSSMYRLL